jgi:hypothetical protein
LIVCARDWNENEISPPTDTGWDRDWYQCDWTGMMLRRKKKTTTTTITTENEEDDEEYKWKDLLQHIEWVRGMYLHESRRNEKWE